MGRIGKQLPRLSLVERQNSDGTDGPQECRDRWYNTLVTARTGKWTVDEDEMLKETVGAHGANDWEKVAALVIGRTKIQCRKRWCDNLVSNINPTTVRASE